MHVSSVALRWHCRRHTRHGHMPPPLCNTAPALSHDLICMCRLWRCVCIVADIRGTGRCPLLFLTPHLHFRMMNASLHMHVSSVALRLHCRRHSRHGPIPVPHHPCNPASATQSLNHHAPHHLWSKHTHTRTYMHTYIHERRLCHCI
jgi:hypothetical protein